ncbi:MAG TPA: thioredoxin domain-containing protein [Steroidobacteraceae bacterium]|nr:thioredoxin domain-containing protein [Steroidobacteraceae bacterium]
MRVNQCLPVAAWTAAMLLSGFTGVAVAHDEDNDTQYIKKELETLRNGQAAIQKQLDELKALIAAKQLANTSAPAAVEEQNISVAIKGAPFIGRNDANLVLVEFFDYDCPFCARHVKQTMPQIKQDYVDTGKLKYVVRDYPIDSLHPDSFRKHEAALCAGDQGKYWEMRASLFGKPVDAADKDFSQLAKSLNLNAAQLSQCVANEKHAPDIRTDVADGGRAGVTGSPTFFLGTVDPKTAELRVLRVIRGARPYQDFKEAIDAALVASVNGKS